MFRCYLPLRHHWLVLWVADVQFWLLGNTENFKTLPKTDIFNHCLHLKPKLWMSWLGEESAQWLFIKIITRRVSFLLEDEEPTDWNTESLWNVNSSFHGCLPVLTRKWAGFTYCSSLLWTQTRPAWTQTHWMTRERQKQRLIREQNQPKHVSQEKTFLWISLTLMTGRAAVMSFFR